MEGVKALGVGLGVRLLLPAAGDTGKPRVLSETLWDDFFLRIEPTAEPTERLILLATLRKFRKLCGERREWVEAVSDGGRNRMEGVPARFGVLGDALGDDVVCLTAALLMVAQVRHKSRKTESTTWKTYPLGDRLGDDFGDLIDDIARLSPTPGDLGDDIPWTIAVLL